MQLCKLEFCMTGVSMVSYFPILSVLALTLGVTFADDAPKEAPPTEIISISLGVGG